MFYIFRMSINEIFSLNTNFDPNEEYDGSLDFLIEE